MKIKAIVTGSTGMVGKGVLLECLESSDVESILAINRRSLDLNNPKLTEILHDDFFDLSTVRQRLAGFNTCFFCLGVSSVGMSEDAYRRTTRDLTLGFAETVLELNPGMSFCYVSGAGTDSEESSRMMWAKVKGNTENTLLAMPFKAAYMFRPGYIQPMNGVKSRHGWVDKFYTIMKPFYPVLRLFPKYVTDSQKISKAMIRAATNGYDKNILESVDINRLAAN